MDTPEDFLEGIEPAIALAAEEAEHHTGVDRREFMFMSLMAAAATTFAGRAVQAQRGVRAFDAASQLGAPQQQHTPPVPLGRIASSTSSPDERIPLATSEIVPSPPQAMIKSLPS